MAEPNTTYRCRGCTQLLPFDTDVRVPSACLRRCQGQCDWVAIGQTDPTIRAAASIDGPLGDDGLPIAEDSA